MDLEKYKDYHITYIEADILPNECKDCIEDCGNCENALLRWPLSKKDDLIAKRKIKAYAVKRLLKEIERLDFEIENEEKEV